jgi:hypothetical protein
MGQSRNGVVVADTTNNAFGDITQLDAFGRLRTSSVTSLIDLKMLGGKRDIFIDEEFNGLGNSAYLSGDSAVRLSTTNPTDYAIRQEFQRNRYQSGKSQQIFMTFAHMSPVTDIVKRVGYFTSNQVAPFDSEKDGLWLESSNTGITLNISHNGVLGESVPQAEWNVDRLDGSGISGITMDWSKTQIMAIDFEWLGVGRVRWSFVIDGVIVPVHYTNHANITTSVYMRSPNQPCRWEIRQNGSGSDYFDQICATVGSEGGLNELGITRSAIMNGSITVPGSQRTAMIGLRMQTSYLDIPVDYSGFGVLGDQNNTPYLWEVFLNPTIAGTFTYSDEPNSTVQIARGSPVNEVTGGQRLIAGYATAKSSVNNVVQVARKPGSSINGTLDEFVVCVTPLGGDATTYASIDWVEIG